MAMAIIKDGFVISVGLPPCVSRINEDDRAVKVDGNLLNYEDDYWWSSGNICFPEEFILSDYVIQIENIGSQKVLWSWSYTKGDMILDGKLIFKTQKTTTVAPTPPAEKCRKCGGEGEMRLMACFCMNCGALIWGI